MRPRSRIPRWATLALLAGTIASGCEKIAGYDDVEPWPPDASTGGSAGRDGATFDVSSDGHEADGDAMGEAGAGGSDAGDGSRVEDARSDHEAGAGGSDAGDGSRVEDARSDHEAGACPILTGNDACASVPHFTAERQIVDGIGAEFCDIPAMVFDVDACPVMYPSEPPSMPEKVYLRIAWSTDAFHLHVHVVDPAVLVNPDSANLWDSDAVEIYLAGASGSDLKGSYGGSDYGGPIQIVLAPPGAGYPTRGQAFFNPTGGPGTNAPINASIYAGRLVPDGYELEVRYPWVAFSQTPAPGKKIAFDIAVAARQDADASKRQIQCIISNVFVDGALACKYSSGTPAQPYCDDRSWCQPELLP